MKYPDLNSDFELKPRTDKKIRFYLTLYIIFCLTEIILKIFLTGWTYGITYMILAVPTVLIYFHYKEFLIKNWFKLG